MTNTKLLKWKMDRLYRLPQSSIYTHRFFEDLTSGYSYILGINDDKQEFLTLEPSTSVLAKKYAKARFYDTSHQIEKVISSTIFSLLVYGKAYINIDINYTIEKKDGSKENTITSVDFKEILGFPVRSSGATNFCVRTYDGNIMMKYIDTNTLIKLDLKDLGWRRTYFRKIVNKLQRYDTTKNNFVISDIKEYNFSLHAATNRVRLLKLTRNIGWSFSLDELSDSSILYRKIQKEKLQLCLLRYVVDSMNTKLADCIGENSGKIVIHDKQFDYDKLWSDYDEGKITLNQLTNILFRK